MLCGLCVSVFDDGDEKTLRRTSLCLKGERHFAESEVSYLIDGLQASRVYLFLMLRMSDTCRRYVLKDCHPAVTQTLDQLPLTNPEHFGTPVIGKKSNRGGRRSSQAV